MDGPTRVDSKRYDLSAAGDDPNAQPLSSEQPAAPVCSAPAVPEPTLCEANAVRSLTDGYTRANGPPLPPATAPTATMTRATATPAATTTTPRSENNAGRTSARQGVAAYVNGGRTNAGEVAFSGVAALKGHDAKNAMDVEVFSASAQIGAEGEFQAGLARVGGTITQGEWSWTLGAEVLSARVNLGVQNDDDSRGLNVGVMATGVGAETTVAYHGWSATAGASASVGFAVSSGERNIDGDAVAEKCFKGSIGVLTLGVCTEFD